MENARCGRYDDTQNQNSNKKKRNQVKKKLNERNKSHNIDIEMIYAPFDARLHTCFFSLRVNE